MDRTCEKLEKKEWGDKFACVRSNPLHIANAHEWIDTLSEARSGMRSRRNLPSMARTKEESAILRGFPRRTKERRGDQLKRCGSRQGCVASVEYHYCSSLRSAMLGSNPHSWVEIGRHHKGQISRQA